MKPENLVKEEEVKGGVLNHDVTGTTDANHTNKRK